MVPVTPDSETGEEFPQMPIALAEYSALYESIIRNCSDIWKRIPDKGVQIEGGSEIEDYLRQARDFYNFSLLEFFGFLEILHGNPETGRGW